MSNDLTQMNTTQLMVEVLKAQQSALDALQTARKWQELYLKECDENVANQKRMMAMIEDSIQNGKDLLEQVEFRDEVIETYKNPSLN